MTNVMSDNSTKRLCSLCLSTDRKLSKLCWIPDAINLLYMLLTHDSKAYKEGFFKDRASLLVCWECCAMVNRIKRFQVQICFAQLQLASIADGEINAKLQTLSRLTTFHNGAPQYDFQSSDMAENFIDCGPVKEIKTESDTDDLPLSLFFYENDSDNCEPSYDQFKPDISKFEPVNDNFEPANDAFEPANDNFEPGNENEPGNDNFEPSINNSNLGKATQPGEFNTTYRIKTHKPSNLNTISTSKSNEPDNLNFKSREPMKIEETEETLKKKNKMKYSKYFSKITMSEEEMLESLEKRRMDINKDTVFKCDNCIVRFKTKDKLINHNLNLHSKKDNLTECDICHIYTKLPTHRQTHYQRYNCVLCTHAAYTHMKIVGHLKRNHKDICCGKRKGSRRNNGQLLEDLPKYPCSECELIFQNKDLRWKHVQRAHREGHKCNSCDKKFAFKNNLKRHERTHQDPLPREECPSCHKMIRVDLVKAHSRIHTDRQKFVCVECDKNFVSRETYESHLKYAQAHATVEVCRHNCPSCHKGYRSRLELRDHINYKHKGRTEHKCPVCGKGLATKRCIRRHVRRAHEGIKESAKDKICQQCGKAFRDKKGLVEHERVHTGARPLSCAACGRTFRQRAALYAHARRVHPPAETSSAPH